MTDRQIAILIDGGFFLKRLPKLVKPSRCRQRQRQFAPASATCAGITSKYLTGSDDANWQRL